MPPGPPPRGDERRALDLAAEGITSVLWTTGFAHDFAFVDVPGFAEGGVAVHRRGVTAASGVFVLGLPWMHTMKSSVLCGVGDDAAYVAERIVERDSQPSQASARGPIRSARYLVSPERMISATIPVS